MVLHPPAMSRLVWVVACVLGSGVAVACAAVPPEDAADFEVDLTDKRTPPSSTGGTKAPPPRDDVEAGVPSAWDAGSSSGSTTGPAPSTVTVKVSGTTLKVAENAAFADLITAGTFDFYVNVSGTGAAAGSDLHVAATHTGKGCERATNFVWFRPKDAPQYTARSANEPGCGLAIDELPTAVGGHFRGSFHGTLYSIESTPRTTKTVDLVFDVVRTK